MARIIFYVKATTVVLENTDNYFFVMNDKVYCDSNLVTESQAEAVSFEDFIKPRPDIGWIVKEDV